jgi:penicillin-binding protein 1B
LHPELDSAEAPYFVDLMREELQSILPETGLPHFKYRINTTLDLDLQRDAVEAIRIGLQEVDRRFKQRPGRNNEDALEPQVALIALDPHSGEIKALVGGRDYSKSQLNRATALRQPGSIFKPFVYAAALETTLGNSQRTFTPASILRDEPTTFLFNRQTYAPNNFGHRFSGNITLRRALARSVNVATVQLAELIGYQSVVRVAKAAGLERADATPSVALGAYDATPLDMAGAYTAFANEGTYVEPHFISSVQNEYGAVIYTSSPERHRVLDPRVAFQMTNLLEEVLRTGTGAGVRSRGFRVPAAGKTGTSRDGWFAGFVSNLLCVVWVGFDDHRDLRLEGSRSALPIWTEFMKRALQHGATAEPFRAPPGIVAVALDPETGQLVTPYCESSRTEFFISGTEPQESCTLHSFEYYYETLQPMETVEPAEQLQPSEPAIAPTQPVTAPTQPVTAPTQPVTAPTQPLTEPSRFVP